MLRKTSLLFAGLFLVFFIFYLPSVLETRQLETPDLVVGIALTSNHGTASLRNEDGSFRDLGRIEGSPEYTELMRKLASWDTWHPSPPYFTMEDMWHDYPRQMLRSARKNLGFPASSDVAIIARFLKDILVLVDIKDRQPPSILISFPALPGLFQEDISDAATYVGLRGLRDGYEYHPHEIVAAYAGNGLGLNTSCDDPESCDGMGNELNYRPTLLVEYTETALLVHHRYMDKALEIPWPRMTLKVSFDLASDQQPSEQDLEFFFLKFLCYEYGLSYSDSCNAPEKITVILTGSPGSVADGKVQNASKTVVQALQSEFEGFFDNSEYIAARGAAELAWRALRPREHMEI